MRRRCEPRLVAKREAGVEYAIEEARGVFYILTNADGAEDFKIVTAPVARAAAERTGRIWCRTSRAG